MIGLVASSTGGHLYPAIAVAQEWGRPCVFFGLKSRLSDSIVTRYGFPFCEIPMSTWNPLVWLVSFGVSVWHLKTKKIRVLVSAGGNISFFVGISAWCLRIPIILLEQNVIPGRVTRALQFFATRICLSFIESKPYFRCPKNRISVTGNPIRKKFFSDHIFDRFSQEPLPNRPLILVMTGSQGAQFVNTFIKDMYPYFLNSPYCLVHITGSVFYSAHFQTESYTLFKNETEENKIVVMPYFERMDYLYQRTSCAITRAGATTIAELLAYKIPSILVPFPFARDQHQLKNARIIEQMGSGICVEQSHLSVDRVRTFLDVHAKKRDHVSPDLDSARCAIADFVHELLPPSTGMFGSDGIETTRLGGRKN